MDELETTFELPEPTPTTAYIASKGGIVNIQLSVNFTINGTNYDAYDVAEIHVEESEEPTTITVECEEGEDRKIFITGDVYSARFTGFISHAKPLVKGV
ncbi:MAG: hypothetical protein WC977_10360 [Anaerovoracaceae bacterium]